MKKERTISDAIKIVLKDKPEGMTVAQIYSKIIENRLYEFNAQNPLSVVTSTIRSSCVGVDNKFTTRVREFIIVKEDGDNTYYALNSVSYSEWWPTPEEYDPGFSVEDWLELFKDKTVFTDDSMKILTRILKMGGEASCKELSEKYGEDSNYYNKGSSALAQRIHKKTKCPLMTRDDGGSRWWTVLYLGKNQEAGKKGEFVWKLREELKEAVGTYNSTVTTLTGTKVSRNSWLLCWNPKNYDWDNEEGEYSYDTMIKNVKEGGAFVDGWRCQSTKVKAGDRFFLIRLGVDPKGIVAAGYTISDSFYNDNGVRCVDTVVTNVLDYKTEKIIPIETLKEKFPNQHWSPQGSGISLDPDAAQWLIDNWNSFNTTSGAKAAVDDSLSIDPSEFRSNSRYKRYFIPLTEVLYNAGGSAKRTDAHKMVIDMLNISEEELSQGSKTHDSVVINDIDWARNYLNYEGFIDSNAPNGIWKLSDIGQKYEMTEELAEKIIVKWVKITTARRKGEPEPVIDLTPYYKLRRVKYTRKDFLNDVYMSESRYDELKALLINKQNIILQGAPGVGKTFSAERLAYSIMGEKDDSRIEFIQFHQNYSYEDFIMGYRPNDEGGFNLKEGVFYRFCEKARNDTNNRPYFFIIDEINRGNLSKIFGELLMLIEKDYRKRSAKLAYRDEYFSVPGNLYIIGMMNTADRSLALIDYALRRRFSFFEMEPGFDSDGFKKYAEGLNNTKFKDLIEQIKKLNDEITSDKSLGKGFRIGHSYFCGKDAESCTIDWLRSVVKYDIMPTLEEYWFDDLDKVSKWETNLNGALND